jgi:hypothetical protein
VEVGAGALKGLSVMSVFRAVREEGCLRGNLHGNSGGATGSTLSMLARPFLIDAGLLCYAMIIISVYMS